MSPDLRAGRRGHRQLADVSTGRPTARRPTAGRSPRTATAARSWTAAAAAGTSTHRQPRTAAGRCGQHGQGAPDAGHAGHAAGQRAISTGSSSAAGSSPTTGPAEDRAAAISTGQWAGPPRSAPAAPRPRRRRRHGPGRCGQLLGHGQLAGHGPAEDRAGPVRAARPGRRGCGPRGPRRRQHGPGRR